MHAEKDKRERESSSPGALAEGDSDAQSLVRLPPSRRDKHGRYHPLPFSLIP